MCITNISCLLLFLFFINSYGQIGINTASPSTKSLFHISERSNPTDTSSVSEPRGIIIPRLTESERNLMAPTNDDNSLLIFNTTENCYNYWDKNEGVTTILDGWKSLCGSEGNAKFEFPCIDNNDTSNIIVNGKYIKDKDLDGNNYITINNVNVTKKVLI